MGAVLFTLLVQGLSIELVVRLLGLDSPLVADRLVRLEGDFLPSSEPWTDCLSCSQAASAQAPWRCDCRCTRKRSSTVSKSTVEDLAQGRTG